MWSSHGLRCVSVISATPPGVILRVLTGNGKGKALLTQQCVDPDHAAACAERLRQRLTAT
jgi:hypothetical protein